MQYEVFMCFLFAENIDELEKIKQKAIETGHYIVNISDRPLSCGNYMITTIPPGDSIW